MGLTIIGSNKPTSLILAASSFNLSMLTSSLGFSLLGRTLFKAISLRINGTIFTKP
jgi:hypothetical protein